MVIDDIGVLAINTVELFACCCEMEHIVKWGELTVNMDENLSRKIEKRWPDLDCDAHNAVSESLKMEEGRYA